MSDMTKRLPLVLFILACSPAKVASTLPPGGGADASSGADAVMSVDAPFSFAVTDGSLAEAKPPNMSELDCPGAARAKGNAGCDFYAVPLPVRDEGAGMRCFAMYV